MKNARKSEVQSDYNEFVRGPFVRPPDSLSVDVLRRVRSTFEPSPFKVLFKLAVIQSVVGATSLAFCPQFGLSFTEGSGLMQYLMRFGHEACMVGCGVFFVGLSFLTAAFVLSSYEIRTIKRQRILYVAAISGLSLGGFICLGAEVTAAMGALWLLGATLGGATTVSLGWKARKLAFQTN